MKSTISKSNKSKGFTLIELLVVIGILVVLLAVVLIAMNPARQFGQANNTKRRSDVSAILNAVGSFAADHRGELPTGVGTSAVEVGTICTDLVTEYISALPVDPTINDGEAIEVCATGTGATNTTGYMIVADSDDRVTISASVTDNAEVIEATR